jgi:hypothetical protein
MKRMISRIALFEDTQRLALHDATLASELHNALRREPALGRLGATATVSRAALLAGLRQTRDAWGQPETYHEPRIGLAVGNMPRQGRLAFCLGGLVGLAATRWLPQASDQELIQQEAHMFQALYRRGHENAFESFLTLSSASNEPAIVQFSMSLFLRTLAASHTLMPDISDPDSWFCNLLTSVDRIDQIRSFSVDLVIGAEAQMPHIALYDEANPIVALTRSVQLGMPLSATDLETALRSPTNTSNYAQALVQALRNLQVAAAFWHQQIEQLEEVRL